MTAENEITLLQHPRSAIRNAIKDQLSGQIPEIGDRVEVSRFIPYGEEDFPLILIYSDDEDSTPFSIAPRSEKRTLRIAIAVLDKAEQPRDGKALQNRLDDFLFAVDQRLLADPELKETVESITYLRQTIDTTEKGNRVVIAHTQEYEAVYYFDTTIRRGLDPFKSIGGTIETLDNAEVEFQEDIPQT